MSAATFNPRENNPPSGNLMDVCILALPESGRLSGWKQFPQPSFGLFAYIQTWIEER